MHRPHVLRQAQETSVLGLWLSFTSIFFLSWAIFFIYLLSDFDCDFYHYWVGCPQSSAACDEPPTNF